MNIGEIYWLKSVEEIPHPRVIVEINNDGVLVVSLTTNMNKINFPGNVLLDLAEGNLEKQSIVEVSKTESRPISDLGHYVGRLSPTRIKEIKNGIGFLERTYF